jgi:hypothetical protein
VTSGAQSKRPRRLFRGTFARLQHTVALTGIIGEWQYMPARYWRFRCCNGAILNWWESTGTINFQGPEPAKAALEHALDEVVTKARQPIPRLPDGRRRKCRG